MSDPSESNIAVYPLNKVENNHHSHNHQQQHHPRRSNLNSRRNSRSTSPVGSLPKRVSFASLPSDDLKESLLSNSFTASHDFDDDTNNQHTSPHAHELSKMSDQRLRESFKKQQYSSLSTHDDDDMPPPLEATSASDHLNCSGHGHSHGRNDSSSHSHSHGSGADSGRTSSNGSRSNSRSPSTPRSPRRSPADNCGGLKNRKKESKAAAANSSARRALGWASVCCCVFMICEVIGGFLANSLAIMTDAAHMLSDLAGFLISIFALWLATRPATSRLSFGFHRAEILGALISVLLIWLLTGVLIYEACWRLIHPEEVNGKYMFIVASIGLGANFLMGMILIKSGHGHSHGLGGGGHDHSHGGGGDHGHSHGGGSKKKKKYTRVASHGSLNGGEDHGHSHGPSDNDHGHAHGPNGEELHASDHHDDDDHHDRHEEPENLNVKAALIHVIGDAIQSIGVMIAAGLIWYEPEWRIADPLCTFLFSILVLFTTTRLIRQSVAVLMEGVPDGIDPTEVEESLLNVPGVIAVHDLHIWSLSVGKPSLSVHLYCSDDAAHVLAAANKMCADEYNIHHSTIQVERQHDNIECNDAYLPGQASLDVITTQNFAELGIQPTEV